MQAAQLFQHFKDNDITTSDVAEATGYNLVYLHNILMGYTPLTDKAKGRFVKAYPATGAFLMNGGEGVGS